MLSDLGTEYSGVTVHVLLCWVNCDLSVMITSGCLTLK